MKSLSLALLAVTLFVAVGHTSAYRYRSIYYWDLMRYYYAPVRCDKWLPKPVAAVKPGMVDWCANTCKSCALKSAKGCESCWSECACSETSSEFQQNIQEIYLTYYCRDWVPTDAQAKIPGMDVWCKDICTPPWGDVAISRREMKAAQIRGEGTDCRKVCKCDTSYFTIYYDS